MASNEFDNNHAFEDERAEFLLTVKSNKKYRVKPLNKNAKKVMKKVKKKLPGVSMLSFLLNAESESWNTENGIVFAIEMYEDYFDSIVSSIKEIRHD